MARRLAGPAAAFIGLLAALILFATARAHGVSLWLGATLAAVTGLALWVAALTALKLSQAGYKGPQSAGTVFVGSLVIAGANLMIQALDLDKPLSTTISLFFIAGLTLGLAFGAVALYLHVKTKARHP